MQSIRFYKIGMFSVDPTLKSSKLNDFIMKLIWNRQINVPQSNQQCCKHNPPLGVWHEHSCCHKGWRVTHQYTAFELFGSCGIQQSCFVTFCPEYLFMMICRVERDGVGVHLCRWSFKMYSIFKQSHISTKITRTVSAALEVMTDSLKAIPCVSCQTSLARKVKQPC